MTKESGLGDSLFVAEFDLSGDVGQVNNVNNPRSLLGVSSIQDLAEARILGRKDGSIGFTSYWNISAGQAHPVLSALPTTDRIVSYFHGSTLGNPAASMTAKLIDYAPTLGADGSLLVTNTAQANGYGLEWSGGGTGDGMLTTGKQSFATGTVNGSSIDLGAVSTLFGAAAYLHVFSVASGTATFAVQDSADNSSFSDVTGMVFAAATGATSERVQGAVGATVQRYVRLQGRGTHGAAVVACNFVRYLSNSAA
jgi:hypothetical protein